MAFLPVLNATEPTKIFFRTSEPRAAKWISETLGEIEVERLRESRTPEPIGSRRNYALEIATKPLVLASEIAGLAPLQAYIKQGNRVTPVRFAYRPRRSLQPEFLERTVSVPEPRPVSPAVAESVSARAEPVQLSPVEAPARPEPALSLFAEPVAEEPQSEPRRSAFKKKEGAAREWKPVD